MPEDIDATEVVRLHGLPDRWLAEGILRLVRELRGALAGPEASPLSEEPAALLLWHVAPELARRLGASRLLANEAARGDVRAAPPWDLRLAVATALASDVAELGRGKDPASARAAALLGRKPESGNPIAFALDRVAPPPPPEWASDDRIATRILRRARALGMPDTTNWTPAMLVGPGVNGIVLRPEFRRRPVGNE
jgi:hypothetical protein